MAIRPTTEFRVAPSLSPQKAVELLRKQIQRAPDVENLPYDDPKVKAWSNTTQQIAVWAFGKPHDNVSALEKALNPPVFMTSLTTDADLQEWHVRDIRNSQALLESFVEQLEFLASVSGEAEGEDLTPKILSNKIFVVHGHAEQPKIELALLLTGLGLEPVILHEQPNQGMTLIEKLERHSKVGYAFVLLTPDDVGCEASRLKGDAMFTRGALRPRARQNVVFEFGRFAGLLGRNRVCCLYSGAVELPSDVQGLLYIRFTSSINECQAQIIRELRAAGYQV